MATLLQQTADVITEAAGWKRAAPDERGVFHFSLEGGLDFDLFSPENRTAILFAGLGPAPDEATPQGEAELRRLASLAAGSLKKRRSVFGIGESGLELYLSFPLSEAPDRSPALEARDFLNDLAWWKKQLSGAAHQSGTSASPFSFAFGGWFPGS